MKKIIKFVMLIVLAILISCIFACVPVKSAEQGKFNDGLDKNKYNYREFVGREPAAQGLNLYFIDLVAEPSYLCAWHGGIFFNRQPIVIKWEAEIFGHQYNEPDYKAAETWEHFVVGKRETNKARVFHMTRGIGHEDGEFEYDSINAAIDTKTAWASFKLTMVADQYSGNRYIKSVATAYGYSEGKREEATVTSTGWTRFWVTERHYEKNTPMAYLLADCEDNGNVIPRASYVNIAFWAHLNDTSTQKNGVSKPGDDIGTWESMGKVPEREGTPSTPDPSVAKNNLNNIGSSVNIESIGGVSASSTAIATTSTTYVLKEVEWYLQALEEGKKLTNDQCDALYNTSLAEQEDQVAYELFKVIEEYKKSNKNDKEIISKLKESIKKLIDDMNKNAEKNDKKEENQQNTQDFGDMWEEIGDDYEKKIFDRTKQDEVTVEYNATTQKYLIGPFQIEYVEKYTSDWSLASMTGDPDLIVNKNGNAETIKRSSGKWNFYYLNGLRVDGIPGTGNGQDKYGYNEYPHNNEPFYIQLDYEDGINAILGLKLYFRYMQAEAEWSKSEGEIENVNWEGYYGSGLCSYEDRDKLGLCDGGASDIQGVTHNDKEGGHTHWHGEDSEGGNHDIGRYDCGHATAHYKCGGHSCGGENCSGNHKCSGPIGCEGHYTCDGHECGTNESWGARKCPHGYYANHYSFINLWFSGQFAGSCVPIQFIGTCHWAWRLYFDVDRKFEWNIDITTGLAGDVWLDIDAQKDEANANATDGDKESMEHGVDNVLVTIKLYQDGAEVGDAIFHDDEGKALSWPIITENGGHYQVDRIEAPGRAGGRNCYYVAQFEYDGQVYESTVFLQNGGGDDTADQYTKAKGEGYFDKSMAVERSPERRTFDETFSQIKGDSEMNSDHSTTGTTSTGKQIDYKGESEANGSASMIKSEFISGATADHENMQSGWEKTYYDRYCMKAYTYYSKGTGITTGANAADYQIYYPFDDEGKSYTSGGEIRYIMNKNRTGASGGNRYIDEYMLHINLGLRKRKETDISLIKDLYKMSVVVNEQEIVQNFNCLVDSSKENGESKIKYNGSFEALKKELERRRAAGETSVNNLGLFSTDVAYNATARYKNAIDKVQEIKSGTELRVFATYAIRIYNNSDTNDVQINELTDYYDDAYTVVDSENMIGMEEDGIYAKIVNDDMERNYKLVANKPYYRILSTTEEYEDISWKPTKEENLKGIDDNHKGTLTWSRANDNAPGMQKSTTTSLENIKLKVNEYIEIFTTYEIDYEGYEKISDPDNDSDDIAQRGILYANDEKDNIAEISNYSTFYSERDVEIDGSPINFYRAYEEGQNSGKIDKDSAPNNIIKGDITNISNYEDDTCRALPLKISLEAHERDMYGYVFEDMRTDNTSNGVKVKTGDGIYGGSDKLIPKVKVSMYEVISLADINETNIKFNDLEYYYEVPLKYYNIGESSTTGIATGDNSIVTSENPVSGKEGNYCIYGYLPGDYVLRFDYGTQTDSNKVIYSINEDGSEHPENKAIIKYNGQDYENTSFLADIKYSEDGKEYSAINDKFLNLRTEDMKTADGRENGIKAVTQKDDSPQYSVSRDNEARRMVVDAYSRTIENDRGEILRDRIDDNSQENGRYVEATAMFAETPIMQIEINEPKKLNEDDTDYKDDTKQLEPVKTIDNGITTGDANKKINVTKQEYHIKNINLGLEERARTDIRLEQYIEGIYLMKEDDVIFSATLDEAGKVITNNEDNSHLDKLTYLAHVEADNSNQQGFYAISVEDDYLNGLSMSIEYKIKIINNSETDFTGDLSKYYVAKDIIEKAKFAPTTEAYTSDIAKLLEENNETGMATNATLKEILRLGQDSDATLSSLLSQSDKTNIGNGTISENDTLRPDIIVYGKYVGRFYYENEVDEAPKAYVIKQYKWSDSPDVEITYQSDKIVKTTVDQLIDYIDPNASYDLSTQNFENYAWDLSGNIENTGERRTIPTLNELVSESSYRTIVDNNGVSKSNIYDRKGNALVTDVSSNIVIAKNNKMTKFDTLSGNVANSGSYLTEEINNNWVEYRDDYKQVKSKDNGALNIELEPQEYDRTNEKENSRVTMWIMTAKTTASDTDANNMKFDNLVEVLVYSNPTGRRDYYSVPGNAMALATQEDVGFWKAGYNSKKWWNANDSATSSDDKAFAELASEKWHLYPEDDAYAPEFVTIIAPTGITLREYVRNVIIPIAILITIIMIMLGIFGVKQIKIYKEHKADK